MIRIGTDKVRTGCLTCKRRRVKCDEGHPECQRCIKGGRTCEGYARSNTPGSTSANPIKFVVYSSTATTAAPSRTSTRTNTPTRTPSPPSQLTSLPDLGHAERRALFYFQEHGAQELAGGMQPMFWLRGVLPVVYHEAAVKHALVALSTMHEHFTRSGRMSPNTNSHTLDFALNHYGRAIRAVMDVNRNRGEHFFDCSLITCGLFAAFESLQGHYHSACSHAVSGIKILVESQDSPDPAIRTSDNNMYISQPELTRFFCVFWRQILEIGDWNFQGERPVLDPPTINCPPIFDSIEEALIHVDYNVSGLFHFYEKAERTARTPVVTPVMGLELEHEFRVLTTSVANCEQAYEAFLARRGDHSVENTPSELVLNIHRLVLKIYTNVASQGNDIEAFDTQLPNLSAALDFCEKFIALTSPVDDMSDALGGSHDGQHSPYRPVSPPTRPMPPSFSIGLGVVPVLFVIATRCSDVAVRDKAIQLLRICNRKEGFWDSQLSAVLATRIFEIKATAASQAGNRELRNSDIQLKVEDIQYYPDNECVVSYALMWEEPGKGEGEGCDDEDDDLALGLHPGPGPPREPMLRKRLFSERLAWGDQPCIATDTDTDTDTEQFEEYPGVTRNRLISEEIRPPLRDWEKYGLMR